MKYNHKKAAEIYKHIDEDGKIYNNIKGQMKNSVILADFAFRVGQKLSAERLSSQELEKKFIATAEAIYKGLQETAEGKQLINNTDDRPLDDLFGIVYGNLLHGLDQYQFNSIIGDVEEIYDM